MPTIFILSAAGTPTMQSLSSNNHCEGKDSSGKPFFLYYPSNSNHGPYTPDKKIGDKAVKGAGRTMSGQATSVRLDYIYENDVALGRLH